MNSKLPVYASLAALALLQGCWLDGEFKHRGPTRPEPLDDGWEIAEPEELGLDPGALGRIHDQLLDPERFVGALGFLVAKQGRLVFETYLRQAKDRDHVHHLQSTTKSITSLVVGIAQDKGWLPPLDTPLCSILIDDCAGLDPRKQRITLQHLLTMRSGLRFDNDDFSVEMWVDKPSRPARYILRKPLYADPGEAFYYRDADPQLMGYALQALTDRTEEDLAAQYLFEPLGIKDWYWDYGAQGESMAAHGLHLRLRDLAKIGQLVLNGGVYDDRRVVSEAWLSVALANQVEPTGTPEFGYGYYWWRVEEADAYATWGHGGQYLLVVPAQELVLGLISMPDTDADVLHGGLLQDFVDLTGPLWR